MNETNLLVLFSTHFCQNILFKLRSYNTNSRHLGTWNKDQKANATVTSLGFGPNYKNINALVSYLWTLARESAFFFSNYKILWFPRVVERAHTNVM